MASTSPHSNGIITITAITTTSVELEIEKAGYSRVELFIRKETEQTAKSEITSATNHVFDDLTPGTCYLVNAKYYGYDDTLGEAIQFDTTTFSLVDISSTSNSIRFYIVCQPPEACGADWQNWQYNVLIKKHDTTSYDDAFGDGEKPDMNDAITVKNLQPETRYDFYVELWHYEYLAGVTAIYSVSTTTAITYAVTIYCQDLSIETTSYSIYNPDGSFRASGNNISSGAQVKRSWTDIKPNSTLNVSCVPKYEFYSWYVRWGSENASLQRLGSIEQTLTITDNLYIKAVGKRRCRFYYYDIGSQESILPYLNIHLINEPSTNGGHLPYTFIFSNDVVTDYIPKITGYNYSYVSLTKTEPYDKRTEYTITQNSDLYTKFYVYYDKIESLIAKWSWLKSNGTASDNLTQTAYDAISNKLSILNFNYLVWNDMVDKVSEILKEKNLSWSSKYATLAATIMSEDDKVLTAARFNSLRFNIGSHYSTGINEVQPGDDVFGSYFIILGEKINAWIDSINNK